MLLNELLNIKYPIIQGAMANISDGKFAAAVSNAGGMGIIASGGYDSVRLNEEIEICRSLTDKPFGVNVMLMNPDVENIIDVICRQHVTFVTTGAGNPGVYVQRLKESGTKIFPVVANVALAKRLERSGVDGLIVEGTESGGHVGEATTMAIVPQVIDAVNIPVVAAGGIASGRQVLAALSLGACGVQVGTIMLATVECPIHQNYKDALIKAKDSSTTVTGRSQGAPVRILKNEMAKEYLELEARAASRDELEHLTLGGLRRAVLDGDMQRGSVMMGQVAGMIDKIRSVKEVLEYLVEDTIQAKQSLQDKLSSLEEIK